MPIAADPIRRRRISDEVLARLLEEICAGRTAPGNRLPSERALARLFKIGRLPVREAYQELEQMGIVRVLSRVLVQNSTTILQSEQCRSFRERVELRQVSGLP